MQAKFHTGQTVTAKQFTDCFGKIQPAVEGLTVAEIRLIEPKSIPSYYRIKAVADTGSCRYVEAAESFFAG